MCDYEAVPTECTKALRALASISYSDALQVGEDDRVLQQISRLTYIHTGDTKVQLAAVRALCNMAYSKDLALTRLPHASIFTALIAAQSWHPDSRDISSKASEAVARIVMAEWNPDGDERAVTKVPRKESGSLEALFTAAIGGDIQWHPIVIRLTVQLLNNEVVAAFPMAQRFVAVVAPVAQEGAGAAGAAFGWLTLARQLATTPDAGELPQELVSAGAIRAAASLMERYLGEPAVQLAGVEALSSLVGNRIAGLQAFASAEGVRHIAQAMATHGGDIVLQTKGVRAMSCAIAWPEDLQVKAGYKTKIAVDLTKAAMSHHADDAELQKAALEALAKYLDKIKCKDDVLEKGGEGLVKAVVTRHMSDEKVQNWGRTVLDHIGVEKNWSPKGAPMAV
jgi:hypothetical protein